MHEGPEESWIPAWVGFQWNQRQEALLTGLQELCLWS